MNQQEFTEKKVGVLYELTLNNGKQVQAYKLSSNSKHVGFCEYDGQTIHKFKDVKHAHTSKKGYDE